MYKVSVPLYYGILSGSEREKILEEVRKMGAERIFLAFADGYYTDETKQEEMFSGLRENCRYFKERGFEVGAWFWGLMFKGKTKFHCLQGVCGTKTPEFACPLDEDFLKYVGEYLKNVAKTGVDVIMFDDDLSFYHSGSMDCLCDLHVREINKILGENLSREEFAGHILKEPENKYRSAFLQANGSSLERFAAAARRAVDEIDPHIRLGACAGLASFDIDGTNPAKMAKIFAGNTKPFARLIGAPYWAAHYPWIAAHTFGSYLQDVIEFTRMESAWIRTREIELMAEGDCYPRPRSVCPASYLEGFDTALRAAGCTDGILKYAIDYYSNADYETGYVKFHLKNAALYGEIDRHFSGKEACGVRIYEAMNKVAAASPCGRVHENTHFLDFFFSRAARTFSYNSIPTVYEGEGVAGVAFDENARYLKEEDYKNGLILDIGAAEILYDAGVDVGIRRFGEKLAAGPTECFLQDGNHICSMGGTAVWELDLKENAEILSTTETKKGTVAVSYRYENEKGQKFLVLNVDSRTEKCVLKHYARSRQFAENVVWLSGKKLPAYCYGNPALYTLCKKGKSSLSVGLWNFFEDVVFEPKIRLAEKYTKIEFINCSGTLREDEVLLSDIPAFGFAGFEVYL